MEGKTKCPRCEQEILFETDENEDGSMDVNCEECGATVSISYSFKMEIDDTDIVEVPAAEFECTECSTVLELPDIEEEKGNEEIECEGCNARLYVSWSRWGQDVDVELMEPGPDSDDDDDDDDDEDEEDSPHRGRTDDDGDQEDEDDENDLDEEDEEDDDDF